LNEDNVDNTDASVHSTVIIARLLQSSLGSFDECRLTWAVSLPVGCYQLHPFYRPKKSRWLSWPGCLATYQDGLRTNTLSPIQVLTGPDVEQLHWSRPVCYH